MTRFVRSRAILFAAVLLSACGSAADGPETDGLAGPSDEPSFVVPGVFELCAVTSEPAGAAIQLETTDPLFVSDLPSWDEGGGLLPLTLTRQAEGWYCTAFSVPPPAPYERRDQTVVIYTGSDPSIDELHVASLTRPETEEIGAAGLYVRDAANFYFVIRGDLAYAPSVHRVNLPDVLEEDSESDALP